ncbi:MAG: hypothetical protein IJY90_01745 [Clostridia bacterium]|nr:hypothetical protein [Clostridia bacterium]
MKGNEEMKDEKEELKKKMRLVEKINKDLVLMCFETQPENVGLAFLRIKSNLHKLTSKITGFSMAQFIADFCE